VESSAAKNHIKLQIVDRRPETPPVALLPESCSHLYDYQLEAVETILEHKSGIIKLPTAAGKTLIAVGFALRANCRTAFLVDEIGLLKQASDRWESVTGERASKISDSDPLFVPLTLQSLKSKLERKDQATINFANSIQCIIVDECHILGARTYYRTVQSFRNTSYRLGLSATPVGRSDAKDALVVGALGPIIYKRSVEDLQGYGRLAKGLAIFYDYPGWEPVEQGLKWHDVYKTGIVLNESRNRAIVRICKVTPKPVLCFFEQKRHGFLLLDMLRKVDISCDIVYGAHGSKDRERAKEILAKGEIEVLLCSRIFNKGQDIPEVRSAINAAGYRAFIMSVQKPGRAMRTSEGKDKFVYWDFIDRCYESLLNQSRDRAAIYQETMDLKVIEGLQEAVTLLQKEGLLKEG
jgi:superfamily II DNA or RNA helicase